MEFDSRHKESKHREDRLFPTDYGRICYSLLECIFLVSSNTSSEGALYNLNILYTPIMSQEFLIGFAFRLVLML